MQPPHLPPSSHTRRPSTRQCHPSSPSSFPDRSASSSLPSSRPSASLRSSSASPLLRSPLCVWGVWLSLLLLLCAGWLVSPSAALRVKGVANSDGGSHFLGRFCFDYDPSRAPSGMVEIGIEDPNRSTDSTSAVLLSWAMYSDLPESWPAVLDAGDSLSCAEQRQLASAKGDFLSWTLSPPWLSNSPAVPVMQGVRPRFWFAVLYFCDEAGVKPLRDVSYEVHFTNIQQSDWDKEFGADERGLNTMYLVVLIVYTIFFIVHFVGVHRLRKQLDFLHPIVKLFAFILCVQYVAWVCLFVHYFRFGLDGVGVVWLTYIGQLLDAIARIFFIFLLLLLAHGWTISNDHLHQRWIIAGVLGAFFTLQVAQFGYAWYSFNPRLTSVDKGDLVLQCLVIACYLLLGIYFVFMLVVSYANEIIPPKKRLYLRLVLLFSPWMIGPPLVAIGVLLLDDWVRTKIILTLQTSLTMVAYFVLSFLFWPSRAQEYFSINTGPSTLSDFHAAYDRL